MSHLTPYEEYCIKMITLLEDVQALYMTQLKNKVRQVMKQKLNNAEKATRLFINEYDRIEGKDAEKFGDVSDDIRDMLDNKYYNKCTTQKNP